SVSGASWPQPRGLFGSNAGWPGGEMRLHRPLRSGYIASSNANAPTLVMPSAATSAAAPNSFNTTGLLRFSRLFLFQSLPTLRSFEIAEVRRPLGLLLGHQVAIGAQHVHFLADRDVLVVLVAVIGGDHIGTQAPIGLGRGPGARQRVVDCGDLVAHH